MRIGSLNPNWKGGICSFRVADELLQLEVRAIREIRKRIEKNCFVDTSNGCWIWLGDKFKTNGRPSISFGKQRHQVHRLSYIIWTGQPLGNLNVLHSCDNILCVNPDHLRAGTHADNSQDMVNRGRSCRGEKNRGAILTPEMVCEIRKLLDDGKIPTIIARRYGVSSTAIYRIRDKKTWSHLP